MTKHSLTLCMIVRDEEETIGRAIKSALAVVDEVVVVDTGSTDNTRLIVEGYGARVIDVAWSDDFSAARNAGLSAAYGDWILILDADEVLDSIRPIEMGGYLSDPEAIAYYVRIRNEVHGRQTTVYDKVRLFRNHPEIRYRYPIHEQITPAILSVAAKIGGEFKPSSITVTHHGTEQREERGKRARNQRLLSRAIESYPEEPYFRYQLACEMAAYLEETVLPIKGFSRMLDELEQAVAQVAQTPVDGKVHLGYGPDLYARLATALMAAGRREEALVVVEEGLDRFGASSLLRFTHGVALYRASLGGNEREERLDLAREQLDAMIEQRSDLEPAPISAAYFSLYPLRFLGLVALECGEIEQAREYFRQSLEIDPSYTGGLCGLGRVAANEGRQREALQIYLRALSINEHEVEAWIEGARLLIEMGFQDNARSWLQRLHRALPEHPGLVELLKQVSLDRELVGQS